MRELTREQPYFCKGEKHFIRWAVDDLSALIEDETFALDADDHPVITAGDLFDGREFLECVQEGSIMDYDGVMDCVLVDGCRTNLGLIDEYFEQGDALLDAQTFGELCDEYNVEVVWSNH